MTHETAIVTSPVPHSSDHAGSLGGIVYFGNDWFAENRTSSHHIARLLAQRLPVLYIETPGMRAPSASKRDFKKLWRKLVKATKPPQLMPEHVWVMTMPQIPFRRLPLVGWLNRALGRYLVKRAIRELGLRDIALWFVVPHPGALVGQLGEEFVVYYCIDDYSGLPDVDQTKIARMDEDLTRAADQVFVAAASLLDRKKALNQTATLSPHGVDFSHFHRASEPETPVAEGACNLRHPVIGFFGSIGGWTDVDLLLHVAKTHPEWTLLLIGFASADVRELEKCSNVILTGSRPYEELPEWAKAFDVAVLPYRLNHGSINANPLKLREYLATGKPVVAISTPEVERFAHCVHVAHDREEFVQKIQEALTEDTEAKKRMRLQEVMGSTWQARVKDVLQVVEAGIAKKRSGRE
jgi:glycosyltransferase involved in cell wall biosynthesis